MGDPTQVMLVVVAFDSRPGVGDATVAVAFVIEKAVDEIDAITGRRIPKPLVFKRTFDTETLYEYMNGNSEGYFLYSFKKMNGVTCKKDGITLVVDPAVIGSGADVAPLAERIVELLNELLKDTQNHARAANHD